MALNRYRRYVADSITLNNGTTSSNISDLQRSHDGNQFDLAEAATTPGIQFIVDFINVKTILLIYALAYYEGQATHFVNLELYNYTTTAWDVFCTLESGNGFHTYACLVFDDSDYINASNQARVRFNHPTGGNASHDLYIEQVALLY